LKGLWPEELCSSWGLSYSQQLSLIMTFCGIVSKQFKKYLICMLTIVNKKTWQTCDFPVWERVKHIVPRELSGWGSTKGR
jgi:hypothetical protein